MSLLHSVQAGLRLIAHLPPCRRTFVRRWVNLLLCAVPVVVIGVGEAYSQTSPVLFVQQNWAARTSSATSATVAYNSAQTAGNFNVVVVTWNDTTAQVQAVSDTTGNVYQRAIGPTVRSTTASQSLYYAVNKATAPAGTNTVTVTFTVAAATPELRVAEFSGIDPFQPLDVTAAASGNSASSNSGSVTTRNANDLLIGANWASNATTGSGPLYTSRVITTSGDVLEDRVVMSAGSYAATAPVSPSGPWIMQLAAFRAAGSPQADLTLTKSHTGTFTQGQSGATYTLTVRNSGAWSTSGVVSVTDTLPSGLTATGLSGSGWSCTLSTLTCTRSSVLGAGSSYPAITLTVNVAANAAASVTNTATVTGGGAANTANDTATDATTISPPIPDLTLTKTHTGSFAQGQVGGKYTLTVRNSGTGPTSGVVTVGDILPTGLTATALSGSSWSCTLSTLTCTRSSTLSAGSSYPAITLTVNVGSSAPASVTNTATVSGGGELNTANDVASDVTAITQMSDLTLTKTHAGTFTQGQTGATYTLTVGNSGTGSTSGVVAVSDTLPAGLTAVAIAGTGWACTQPAGPCTRSDVVAPGSAYPSIAVTVNVTSNAAASVINTATVSGGGETNTANDTASDLTAITQAVPDIGLTNTHVGTFTQGQIGAKYTLTVSNGGPGLTSGLVTVSDALPTGLTATAMAGSNWACTQPAGPCTRGDGLAAGASYPPITVTVNVASNAAASVANTATVIGGGDTNAANNAATDITPIVQVADMIVSVAATGAFTQGQTGAMYTVIASNAGVGASNGTVTVTDGLPAGLTAVSLTGTGWGCSVGTLTCSRTDALVPGASYAPITLTVDVAGNAPASITNTVTVSGGAEVNTANDTATDVTAVISPPDLAVASTHAGSFAPGQSGASYAITVSNVGGTASSGPVNVIDTLPTGLTASAIAGAGWTCVVGTVTCTRGDALAAGANYPPITLTVDIAADAPATVTNTAAVSGGGQVNTANDAASDVTSISLPPDLSVTNTHTGTFAQGQTGAMYTLTVRNGGAGPTAGAVTVADGLPSALTATGLTGTGWTCVLGALTCTRGDVLAAGASYPDITLHVNVQNTAPVTVINTATVSGGNDSDASNDVAVDPTTVTQLSDLALSATHGGRFTQGQTGATYTLTVSNVGGGPSVGSVTVADSLPSGLTATALGGTGWTCTAAPLSCTREDELAAGTSYPGITLVVDVAGNAPSSLTNTGTVSGGGETNTANDTANDATSIVQLPDLLVTATHSGSVVQGQTAVIYTLVVSNTGAGPTAGTVSVADTLPSGLTATSMAGAGWSCSVVGLTCARNDLLAAMASYPAISIAVDVSPTAPASVTNAATVSGGGEINTANDTATDVTAIAPPPDLIVTSAHTGNFAQGQTGATYTLTVTNAGTGATMAAVTVTDAVPAGLTATALSGPGWACSVTTVSCTRSDALAATASYPAIALTVNVSSTAPASVANVATVGGGGELTTANDTATDVTTITAVTVSPPVVVTEAHSATSGSGTAFNNATLSVTVSGTNTLLLAAWHAEWDGKGSTASPSSWTVTRNGVPGTPLVDTNGYNGGAGNRRFRVYYWLNPPAGVNTVTVANPNSGSNELAMSAVLLANVSQTTPLGSLVLDVSTTPRTGESETAATTPNDLVMHVIADALCTRGTLGTGETSTSVANDGMHCGSADGDASLWIATKPATATSTTVSSSGWPSGPAPSPRILNGAAIVVHGAGPDIQAPAAPSNLVAATVSGSQVSLSWTPSTDNIAVTGYRIERCQGASCASFAEIAAPSGTTAAFADTSVAAGTSYSYRVRATDAAGNLSGYSNTSGATTPAPDVEPPSAPGLLTATPVSGTQVNLNWGAATDNVGVAVYRVERCDGVCTSLGFVKIGTIVGTTFADSVLTLNTTYSYIVSAEDTANNLGPYSNVATVTTLSTNPALVAAYSFDEGAGTTATDASGNSRTGTIANATWTASGKFGKALTFNGTSAKVRIPDDPGLHLSTGMTIEAWVNPSTTTAAWRDVVYKGDDNYFLMGTTSQSGRPSAGGTFGATNVNAYGPATLALNTWSHLAATYDGSVLRLYVNGAQTTSLTQTGALAASTNPLEIGGDGIYGQYFKGLIDEVRVYNVALTPSQIQADMVRPIGGTYPFVALSRSSLDFGSLVTGTTSPSQSVTVTNAGGVPLIISGVSITGNNSSEFAQNNTCVTTLGPGAACTVTVTFTPAAAGARAATIVIADNALGAPQTVPLSGTGMGFSITPRVSVLTPALNQQFDVTGGSGGALVWAVDGVPGGDGTRGTITTSGLYTPPAGTGTHTVTVTDQAQASSAAVYLTSYPGTFTHHNDNFRTGQNLSETVLKPTNITPATFGKLLSYPLDGLSIASPLYVAGVTIPGQGVHNVVYVATEHDSVYAFDADGLSAGPLWKQSFLGPGVTTVPADDTGECCDIAPEIGITGTPVIDPATKTLYVVAKTKEGASTYVQRFHALDLGSGVEKFGGPVVVQASVAGNGNGSSGGQVAFDPLHQNQRPSLLLNSGVVYVGFGSHGDHQPYHGWVLGYDASTLQQVMAVNVSPNADGGGIWQANGGPAADAAGNIYVVTGNGGFDADSGGKDFGDSFLKIAPGGTIADYFTPWNQGALNANDFDLGAAGPLLLPDQPGAHAHLMVSAGKNNTIYLVDRDAMGHFSGTTNDNQIVQSLIDVFPFGTPEPGNYSGAVYFNGTVYFGPIADNIQAFPLSNGLLRTSALTRSTDVFKYPGAMLAISATGANQGILWAIQRNGDCGVEVTCGTAAPGVLKAYDAANLGVLLYSSDQMGTRDAFDFATKFSIPLVANGKVFVASVGRLTLYGLLP